MRKIKVALCLLAAAVPFVLAAALAPARASKSAPANSNAIMYLDLGRALNECDEGKKISAELRIDAGVKQKQIEIAKAEAAKSKGKAAKVRQDKVEQVARTLEAEFRQKQEQMQRQRVQPLIEKLRKSATKIGTERHVVVLAAEAAYYVPQDADLTGEIVKQINGTDAAGNK